MPTSRDQLIKAVRAAIGAADADAIKALLLTPEQLRKMCKNLPERLLSAVGDGRTMSQRWERTLKQVPKRLRECTERIDFSRVVRTRVDGGELVGELPVCEGEAEYLSPIKVVLWLDSGEASFTLSHVTVHKGRYYLQSPPRCRAAAGAHPAGDEPPTR